MTFDKVMHESECKNVCFFEKRCLVIRYNSVNRICEIGTLVDQKNKRSVDSSPYSLLDSQQAALGTKYISVNTCFVGKKLFDHEEKLMFVETAEGYFHLQLACSSIPTITNATRAQSAAESGLLECDVLVGLAVGDVDGVTVAVSVRS